MTKRNVHVLFAGRAMCGFSGDPPQGWPDSEVACPITEDIGPVTCTLCKERALHYFAKKKLAAGEVARLEQMEDPAEVAKMIIAMDPVDACAVIDSMNHAQAGLLLATLKIANTGDPKAEEIIARATFIGIRGSAGPVAARDAHFRETGQFLV